MAGWEGKKEKEGEREGGGREREREGESDIDRQADRQTDQTSSTSWNLSTALSQKVTFMSHVSSMISTEKTFFSAPSRPLNERKASLLATRPLTVGRWYIVSWSMGMHISADWLMLSGVTFWLFGGVISGLVSPGPFGEGLVCCVLPSVFTAVCGVDALAVATCHTSRTHRRVAELGQKRPAKGAPGA